MNLPLVVAPVLITLACVGSPALVAQGKFTNLETPHTKPITTVHLSDGAVSRDVVLVCNSADNSVEIYDAQAPHAFLQRVPVGMGPTTVRWNDALDSFYVCNFDGDSVSRVRLTLVDDGGVMVPFAALLRTTFVGDQPADITFDATGGFASVVLSGRSHATLINAVDLSAVLSRVLLTSDEPTLSAIDPASSVAPKAPRQIELLPDGRTFVLNFMGDDQAIPGSPVQVDVDLWFSDPLLPAPVAPFTGLHLGGMGTTNQAFAINSDATKLFVVGSLARNQAAVGEANVAALPFGFVESRMWVVDIPLGGMPSLHAEAASGLTSANALPSRNLNRDYSVAAPTPVVASAALSQPSDVVLIEDGAGNIDRIAITAFHSNAVTILTPSATALGGYIENQVVLPVMNPATGYSVVGPSGITYDETTQLLYVTCRLDSSLRVIDPATNTLVASIQLNNDPTPFEIRRGRQFLYDADFSSGSGFVSCASCHLNGTTDGLRWDLSDPSVVAAPVHLEGKLVGTIGQFPADKGPLVTQTLQGLVDFEVNAEGQYLFTNAPYHWRGDRAGFEDFNGAFVNLMGRSSLLTPDQMFHYKLFINSIVHPPNSEQPINRLVQGTLGANPDDPATATGAKLGLQVFHNFPSDGLSQGGCVGCHQLPDGSDNVFTESFFLSGTEHPLETAALRNLVPREVLLHTGNGLNDPVIALKNAGLTHAGDAVFSLEHLSINFFCDSTVFTYPAGSPTQNRATFVEAVTQYTREFDWGLAPAAGLAYSLVAGDPFNQTARNFFENQVVEANIGLAVLVRNGQTYRGFYYDTSISPSRYREEGTGTLLTGQAVEALLNLPDSAVILQGTPLGNDRRVANVGGVGTQLVDLSNAPSNLTAEPMAPMTYNVDIPKFVDNLLIDQTTTPPTVAAGTQTSLWALRTLQLSVLGSFGINSLHHEPPRRFRITGDNIRPGAKLTVAIPMTNAGAVPAQLLELDLFPTGRTKNGRRIWETEEEMGPIATFAMLNGGPFAPGVVENVYRQTSATTPALDPQTWNKYAFVVTNEDGTVGFTSFVPLQVQDVR